MWSDSLFLLPSASKAKLHSLSHSLTHAYLGDLHLHLPSGATEYVQVAQGIGPGAFTYKQDGEKILLILGTGSALEYAPQAAGYVSHSPYIHGGRVNSLYRQRAEDMYSALPSDVSVIAGHSSGGALAVILGRKYLDDNLPLAGVVTFGSSRPLSSTAVANGPWPQIVNVIHPLDPVPLVAPDGVGQVSWRTPGTFLEIQDDNLAVVTQQPSTAVQILGLIGLNGTAWHNIGSYDAMMLDGIETDPLPAGTPASVSFVETSIMNVYEVTVFGEMLGQQVLNTLHYTAHDSGGGNVALNGSTVLDIFRTKWRAMIIPSVSQTYSVLKYVVRQIQGIKFLDPNADPLKTVFRYFNIALQNGTSNDTGALSGAVFPSFVAVGGQKSAALWKRADTDASVELVKTPKGSIRIAGVLEADTPTLLHELDATNLSLWTTRMNGLVTIPSGGVEIRMAVVSNILDGEILYDTDPGPPVVNTPYYVVSRVNAIAVNKYLTSQVSRKVRAGGH